MPLGFPVEGIESGLRYAPSAGDVFVVSYPKCGTTWLQYIVYLLVRRKPLAPDESLTSLFPHLEEVGSESVSGLPPPRLIKTHLQFPMTPYSPDAKYVVIARNPFDCAVSFYHHTRGFPRHYDFADGSFAEFFECFVAGAVDFGDYFDHLVSWYAEQHRANVSFMTYENLKSNPHAGIRKLAGFLGSGAGSAVQDDGDLDAIVEETSLGSMRRDQQRWSSRRPDWAPPFVRKGSVGDWRNLFEPSQAARLLAEFDRRLASTPASGLWPDVLAEARSFASGA